MGYDERIEQELSTAQAALREGNDGKARVCARRAAAAARGAWLQRMPSAGWQGDAMHQLREIESDGSLPQPVRQAAARLLTKVTEREEAPFSTDPVSDARLIIEHFDRALGSLPDAPEPR